jgi:hypothetical protein
MPDTSHVSSTLEGIAAIISALAWPLVTSVGVFAFRRQLREIVSEFVLKFKSAEQIKVGGFEIAGRMIQSAINSVPAALERETVPQSQVEGARRLGAELESTGIDKGESIVAINYQMTELAKKYEHLRNSMKAGRSRTEEMNKIMAQMRTLAVLATPLLPIFTASASPGERLAAIAILQVQPDASYLQWLAKRMSEEKPFVFFHAALALRQFALEGNVPDRSVFRGLVQEALDKILSFTGGMSDQNTIEVLNETLSILGNA